MNFDPQIVAQANAFVNALRCGKRARVPALKLEYWQQFMTVVYAGLGSRDETRRPFGAALPEITSCHS
jgi:hypothetical protein